MKKQLHTPLADEYLQSAEGMNEAETDPFFYTRLKAKMENERSVGFRVPAKLVWLVSTLLIFLLINGIVLVSQVKEKTLPAETPSLQSFASGYGLTVSSSF